MYYIKFEVSQEKIKEYIGPKDNNVYYGLEINHKSHNISHIVARKEDDLYIISFYEWIYNVEKDLHWLKEFDSIIMNGDRCIFDYGKIKDKILEKYPGLEILKTEVFDSKDKLINKTPDRITFDEELERHKTPYDVYLDMKSEIERIEEEKRTKKILKKAFGPKTKYKNKISIKNSCNGKINKISIKNCGNINNSKIGNIIQDSNIKIDNVEFKSDNFSDLLEKNPMNFDEMHFKTEEEKEDEYIKNELKKANKFKHGDLSIFLNNKFAWACCVIAVMSIIQMIIFINNTIKLFIFFMLFVSSLIALTSKD